MSKRKYEKGLKSTLLKRREHFGKINALDNDWYSQKRKAYYEKEIDEYESRIRYFIEKLGYWRAKQIFDELGENIDEFSNTYSSIPKIRLKSWTWVRRHLRKGRLVRRHRRRYKPKVLYINY